MPVSLPADLWKKIPWEVWVEVFVRIQLFALFYVTEKIPPFERVIQPQEYWLYRFPSASKRSKYDCIVSFLTIPWIIMFWALLVILIFYFIQQDSYRSLMAFTVPSLAIPLSGVTTNVIKIAVGRLRPDYFNRCYGTDHSCIKDLSQPCTGDARRVSDGRKSFPSGHSSLAFCVFGFIFLYTAGQLQTFSVNGRGRAWTLLITLAPLMCACLIAVSRTQFYFHHWQDVVVGSIIGFGVVYIVYRQYFPSLNDPECQNSYPFLKTAQPVATTS